MAEDVVLRFCKVEVVVDGKEESAIIAAYHVSDGIDRCRVGLLSPTPSHQAPLEAA